MGLLEAFLIGKGIENLDEMSKNRKSRRDMRMMRAAKNTAKSMNDKNLKIR